MVENTQNTNSNDEGTGRKRRGLFGSRRRASSAAGAPAPASAEQTPQVAAPETEPAPGAAAPAAPVEQSSAPEQQAAVPAETAPEQPAGAAPEQAPVEASPEQGAPEQQAPAEQPAPEQRPAARKRTAPRRATAAVQDGPDLVQQAETRHAETQQSDSAAADAPAVADEPPAEQAPAARNRRGSRSPKAAQADQAAGASAEQAPEQPDAEAEQLPEAESAPAKQPVVLKAETTTSLLFHAPDIPAHLLRPAPGRNERIDFHDDDRNDRDDRDDRDHEGSSSNVRRRNRRRSGDDGGGQQQSNDPNTVVKVRQPRPEPALITEPQRIKGSTRLEAKKQRRRDGRDAGRRRTVVTESEFLARREAVDRQMIVRAQGDRIEIAVLEDKVLAEHYVTKNQNVSLQGNVYLGRVQNVLPSMEAAFVDIGRGRNAVLYSGEVDWDAAQAGSDTKNQPRRIELALKSGDRVLVQVTKDPVGHKGARLTSQVSLPGRYLVYVPNGSMNGISRKLPDTERARLKKILKEVLPESAGVIVRTAAEGATEEQLTRDVTRLKAQWEDIQKKVESGNAPAVLHAEPDLLTKIIRDVFNEDFQKLIIAGADAHRTIEQYLSAVAPDLLDRVEQYTGQADVFSEFRIQEQIQKALDRKVWLPSGGSLVIDRTEAMTVVDVNTGKFVGSGGNLEETVTKNNLEAAEEIVRQLRLRDIGGIIVVDFIDMVLETNRDLVLRRMIECLSRDRTKHQVAEVTSLGLVQMTRKKIGLGLAESFTEQPTGNGGGNGSNGGNGGGNRSSDGGQQSQRSSRRGKKGAAAPSQPAQNGNGGSNGNGNGNGNGGGNGTHAITEDVKSALAQIAASTIPHDESAPAAKSESAPEQPAKVVFEPRIEKAAEAAVAILDIPVARAEQPRGKRVTGKAADDLLGSVLDALPEPKQPGQGRSRSRRASSNGVTSAPVREDSTEG